MEVAERIRAQSTTLTAAERRVAEAYPRLQMSAPRRLMGSGHGGGYEAGRKADLGGASLGRRGPRQVSR